MAIGYALNGRCYVDANAAHVAFQKDFTVASADHINTLSSSSTSPTGVITYTILSRSLDNATAATSRTGTFTLRPCDYSFLQDADLTHIVFVAALCFAAFMGFRTGFRG